MDDHPLAPKPEKHLINILRSTAAHHPNFALLLGSGASVTSGVKSAGMMIAEWRKQHHELYGDAALSQDEHLEKHHWYNTADEYAYLFQELYDQPSQRREYVETCLESAFPSWGYIYLVNLIRKRVFNVLLTTNFDDLLNEACYQFSSDVRPMVCAHDSSIRSLRVTSKRPKVIKLHGDFLFDDIKNTVVELETLESNMREKLKTIACEYGLIVVGYAGNDRSVMDTLGTILKQEGTFPHGIYWCVRKDHKALSPKLEALGRYQRVHIVEIDGFDEFFANLHDALELELQPELSNPYQQLADKLNALLENTSVPTTNVHPVIGRDIARLGAKLTEMSRASRPNGAIDARAKKPGSARPNAEKRIAESPVPYSLLSQISEREGDSKKALAYMDLQLQRGPRAEDFAHAARLIRGYRAIDRLPDFLERLAANQAAFANKTDTFNSIALELIHLGAYEEANSVLELALDTDGHSEEMDNFIRMNMLQIRRHKGEQLSAEDRQYLHALKRSGSSTVILGAHILLGEDSEAVGLLRRLLSDGTLSRRVFDEWPIFKLLPVDFDQDGKVVERIGWSGELHEATTDPVSENASRGASMETEGKQDS